MYPEKNPRQKILQKGFVFMSGLLGCDNKRRHKIS